MKQTRWLGVLVAALLAPAAGTMRADVRADQKTRVEFGGALGGVVNLFGGGSKDGTSSSVVVKGDRKATFNDRTGQIIDLAGEKVYDLDMRKKTYTVTTFDELRRRMEEARRKAEEGARERPGRQEQTAQADPDAQQMEIDFSIRNTGQSRTINGFDTKQAIMTVAVREKGKTIEQSGGLVLESDMWLAPKIAAMQEVAEFDLRYAKQLYGSVLGGVSAEQMASAMAMYPMMKDAIARMQAEGQKLDGTAIQTVTTIQAVPSAEQAAQEAEASSDEPQKPSGLGGMLGGLMARKMAQKKGGDDGKPSPFMTMTSEVLKVTTAVSASDVAVPAGFKEDR
ncbi:MAG: hypothetical protein IT176_01060 [Acidobacteria bacterium]|nr:hypothetical protein [Acidobacteriota bacterium]